MLHKTQTLSGSTVRSTDGAVGHIDDVLFHDGQWTVEYVVVDTGPWILGRKLLVSPTHVDCIDEDGGEIRVALSRDELESKPEAEEDLPVSELKRREYGKYQKGPVYWAGTGVRKEAFPPGAMPAPREDAEEEKQHLERALYGRHLRSAGELSTYRVLAEDRPIGEVSGLLVDDEEWMLRYIAVEVGTESDRPGGPPRVQIYSPDWVAGIRWMERAVHLNLEYEAASNAPSLEREALVTREYEQKLYDYYGLPSDPWREEMNE